MTTVREGDARMSYIPPPMPSPLHVLSFKVETGSLPLESLSYENACNPQREKSNKKSIIITKQKEFNAHEIGPELEGGPLR